MQLGFSSSLVKSTLNSLRWTSLKASCQIWLCRDSKKLENLVNPYQLLKAQEPQQTKKTSGNMAKAKFIMPKKPEPPQTSMSCRILHKGNACYINASLQSLSSMVELSTNSSLYTDTLSPFVSSFVRTMSMVRSRKSALDPS